jgi:hypothetical protein
VGRAVLISSPVLSLETSTLSNAEVPQSHVAEKNNFLKSAFVDRFILKPDIDFKPSSSGRALAISAWISLSLSCSGEVSSV